MVLVPGPVLDQGDGDGLGRVAEGRIGEQGIESQVVGQRSTIPAGPRVDSRWRGPGFWESHGWPSPARRARAWNWGAASARAALSAARRRTFSSRMGEPEDGGGSAVADEISAKAGFRRLRSSE